MSLRLAHLLSVALIGACLAAPAVAATHTHSRSHGHKKAHSSDAAKRPTLIWRGDVATAQGVVNEVALAWTKEGHGRIELQPFNTASGIDAVALGMADLAGSARHADDSAQDSNLTFTPVAWDALVMVAQASNPINNLTLKQLHDIYLGKITNWSDVGGNSAPIDLYAVASPGDGVEYSLRELLFGHGNQPVAAPRLYVNTDKLREGVELNPNGLGVATLAEVNGNPKLKAIPINGISPNATTVGNGSYVLFTPLYLVTNPRSPKVAEVNAFIAFLQSDAAKAAMRRHAVIPYQDGAALASADAGRRDRIFAEVGVKMHYTAPVIAPPAPSEASTASRVAVATAVADTIAAGPTTAQGDAAGHAGGGDASYTVVKGDTLSGIAKKTGSSVAQLREWNHLKSDQIQLGQTLKTAHD
jgi:phosphate transport system substrate-binding protein